MDTGAGPKSAKEVIAHYVPTLDGGRVAYGVGCAWLGRSGNYQDTLRGDLRTLDRAYEHGFRYFDTSRAYGESERTLGELVSRIDRRSVFIATKANVREQADPRERVELFRRSFEQSFDRLHTGTLDLFQIHDIGHFESVTEPGGILDFLFDARARGMIRYIGAATYSLSVLLPAAAHGAIDTVLSYRQYTPLKVSATPLIRETTERGVGFVNASPLHSGFLTNRDPMKVETNRHPMVMRWQALAAELSALCSRLGVPVLDVALQFPLRNSGIDITLSGPSTAEEVGFTASALRRSIPQPVWRAVDAWLASVHDRFQE